MDEFYMGLALEEAYKAASTYEIPIGAVIVHEAKVIGRGHNMRETLKDPLAHAEMIAIKEASQYLKGWRLMDCTMYVTLEPCSMCAGAIVNSRIDRLVIGAGDSKAGCCGSVINIVDNPHFNHRVDTSFGILEEECSAIIKQFFRELRNK